ncbi:MAG: hypothetical protein QG588_2389 [Candidatus Poribacteria bacterium]|nr:hypothetical protein [Candidatus Poribacteria bacterium]
MTINSLTLEVFALFNSENVKSFNTIEEMLDHLEDLHKEAYRAFDNCTDKQKSLTIGDYFITESHGLAIFNKIIPFEDEQDEKEFEDTASMGYVMVKAWSNACPNGEMGSVHRSRAIAKIIDSDLRKAEFVVAFILSIWEEGGQIDKYDMQWIADSGNLEVLV